MDVEQMFEPVTKWNTSIRSADTIPEIVRKAVRVARSEKPGAVHSELPEDVAKQRSDAKPMSVHRLRRPGPDGKISARAFDLLQKARRPVVRAGHGTLRKRRSTPLRLFDQATGIGVLSP